MGPGARGRLNQAIASALNFRPATVRRMPKPKIVGEMKRIRRLRPRLAMDLLKMLQVPVRASMVGGLLDELGVKHHEGLVDDQGELDGSESAVRKALQEAANEYGLRSAALYVLTIWASGAPLGEKAAAWLRGVDEPRQPIEPPAVDGDKEAQPVGEKAPRHEVDVVPITTPRAPEEAPRDADDAEEDDDGRQARMQSKRSLSTLDTLLVRAIDATYGEELHALGEDELDDAIVEFTKLNGHHHKSYYHAGYADALFGRSFDGREPRDPDCRRWYWVGVIRGWARREEWGRIVGAYDANPAAIRLTARAHRAWMEAIPDLMEALRRADRLPEIAEFANHRIVVRRPALFSDFLDVATELLRSGETEHARRILEMLVKAAARTEDVGVELDPQEVLQAHRRRAHCLRQLQERDRAEKALNALLEQDADEDVHAMVHADLGMIAGTFASMKDVALPDAVDALDRFLERLANGQDHFNRSVRLRSMYSAHGHYCLGVLALGRAHQEGTGFTAAEGHLAKARLHFSRPGHAYSKDLVKRVTLYLAVARANQIVHADKLVHAARLAARVMGPGTHMPAYLVDQFLEGLSDVSAADDYRRVTKAILDTGGDDVLDEVAESSAMERCPLPIAEGLRRRSERSSRSHPERARDARAALAGFMLAEEHGQAREVLDRLEELARKGRRQPTTFSP